MFSCNCSGYSKDCTVYWKSRTVQDNNISLGVSICLDVISIEISISTSKKYQSRRSRKSRRFSKVSLDDQEILVEIEISRFSLDELSQGLTF